MSAPISQTAPDSACLAAISGVVFYGDTSCLFFRGVFAVPRVYPKHATARWGVVQPVGHLTVNEDGEGSNPSAPANLTDCCDLPTQDDSRLISSQLETT